MTVSEGEGAWASLILDVAHSHPSWEAWEVADRVLPRLDGESLREVAYFAIVAWIRRARRAEAAGG